MEISVCLIVKNEEAVITRVLNCVKKFADEIIVVDTGSSDKTKEIAKEYTQKVFDFVWCDDFSKARNFSFSKATKDYVMWIDADDVLNDFEIDKINSLKQNMNADVYMLKYAISFDENNSPLFSYYRERILKRDKNFKWQGFIHEAITPSGKIEYTDIQIEHKKIKETNPKRNLNFYRKHLKFGEKLDSRSMYYYSKELFYNGYYRSCIKNLKKFLKCENKFKPNEIDAFLTMAKCFKFLKEYDKAINCLFKSFFKFCPNSPILCEIAENFLNLEKFDQAISLFEFALRTKPNLNSGEFVDHNYYYLIPYLWLTHLYYKKGNFEKARYYHFLLKEKYPTNKAVIYNDQFFT